MCKYASFYDGSCEINKDKCPYLYYCNKISSYKELSSMPKECKIKKEIEIPKGFYKVSYENKGNLYVEVKGYIVIIMNPYDYIPSYVKMNKLKSGKWKIIQAMG